MKEEINTSIGTIKLYRNMAGFIGLGGLVVSGINVATYILTSNTPDILLAGVGFGIAGVSLYASFKHHQKVKILENPKVIDLDSYRK